MDMPSQWTKLDGVNSIYDIYMGVDLLLIYATRLLGGPSMPNNIMAFPIINWSQCMYVSTARATSRCITINRYTHMTQHNSFMLYAFASF